MRSDRRPRSKQMRADYDQQIAARAEQQKERRGAKARAILDLWKQRVEWWNTKFKHSAHVKARVEKKNQTPSCAAPVVLLAPPWRCLQSLRR